MLSDKAKEAQKEYRKKWRDNLTPEQREKIRDYHREWRLKNPDKVKAYNESYWEKYALRHWDKFGNQFYEDEGCLDDTKSLPLDLSSSKNINEVREKIMIRLRNNGLSYREIAENLGLSHMKVARTLKKLMGNN